MSSGHDNHLGAAAAVQSWRLIRCWRTAYFADDESASTSQEALGQMGKWRQLRWWLLLAVAGSAGAAATLVAGRWLPPSASGALGAAAAAAAGLLSRIAEEFIQRSRREREDLRAALLVPLKRGALPTVGELSDPVALGVHPAEELPNAGAYRKVPPYVVRDRDEEVDHALRDGGLVVIAGESTAGKSRALYEALQRTLPSYAFIGPVSRESIPAVSQLLASGRQCVVWLDDLERFLGGTGLGPGLLETWCNGTESRRVIAATIRSAELERFGPRFEPDPGHADREIWRKSREVIRRAKLVWLDRAWSEVEIARAADMSHDPRIKSAVRRGREFGIAELLSAGPQLAQDWQNGWAVGTHPRGAALVAAAVDCRRAGYHKPLPHELLLQLHEHYLQSRGGAQLRPEPIEAAFEWACQRTYASSSLLIPRGREEPAYLAFDYLLDLAAQEPIPDEIWRTLISVATPEDAYAIGEAAMSLYLPVVAETAFGRAAEGNVDDAWLRYAGAVRATRNAGQQERAYGIVESFLSSHVGISRSDDLRARYTLAKWRASDLSSPSSVAALESVLNDLEHERGRQHALSLEARLHLLYSKQNDVDRAWQLTNALIKDYNSVYGVAAVETLELRSYMAHLMIARGDRQSATRERRQICEDMEELLGTRHIDTLWRRIELAETLGPPDGTTMLEEAVRSLSRSCGPHHEMTLMAKFTLARLIANSSSPARAHHLLPQCVGEYVEAIGRANESTLFVRLYAAQEIAKLGEVGKALDILAELAPDCVKAVGVDNPLTLSVRLETAYRQNPQNLFDLIGTSRLLSEILGPSHYLVARARLLVADATMEIDESLGEELFNTVLEDYERFGGKHETVLEARELYALALLRSGRWADAGTVLWDLVHDSRKALGNEHIITCRSESAYRQWQLRIVRPVPEL